MPRRTLASLGAVTLLALSGTALTISPASAHEGGDEATNKRGAQVAQAGTGKNMTWVANVQYETPAPGAAPLNQDGSDIEFMSTRGRDYALAGTTSRGLQIIDITDAKQPVKAAHYDCPIYQGDVQVWEKAKRIYASYTADSKFGAAAARSQCGRDLALEFQRLGIAAENAIGTVIVELTDPLNPRTVSYLHVPRGSHNMTVHPSGDFLYNSNSDLATSTAPSVEVWDVSDPASPKKATVLSLPVTPTSLGSESHDITFNASGTRAYSAALSQTLVIDTTDPAAPKILSKIVDPAVNVSHGSDPVTLTRADGTKRDLLIVGDELAGAAGNGVCPGGGLHVYDITGSLELDPVKLGTWFIPATELTTDNLTCTAHVFRIYPKQKLATIAWYAAGVRVLDISGLADATVVAGGGAGGGALQLGIKEVGSYQLPDSDTWSFKTNRIKKDGSFYGYGNDLVRGFDVYHFDGKSIGDVPELTPVPLGGLPDTGLDLGAAPLLGAGAGGFAVLVGLVRLARRRTAS